jgi:diguanylate cyclase (GGDEF)-like protein
MITVDIFFIALCSFYLPVQHHYVIIAVYQVVLLSNMMKYGLKFFWYTLGLISILEISVYNLKSQIDFVPSELILNEGIFLFVVPVFISFVVSKLGIPVCILDKYKKESEQARKDKERLTNLIKEKTKELEILATTDMLTEIYNRRKLYEILEHEYTRAKRYGTDLSIIMFDIDYFKKINDTHGHDVGDYVLKTVAKNVKKVIREVDHFGRWGGEEFLIILPQTNLDGAYKAAEKIREVIENIGFGKIGKVTASFGVSTYIKELDNSPDEIVKSADIALYDAKRKGRNTVSIFNYEHPEENTDNKVEIATA